MTRRYYAATLRGGSEPMAIDSVYSFGSYSIRREWLIEHDNSIAIISKLAKKHTQIKVTYGCHSTRLYFGWCWFYNGVPETGE